MKLALTITNLKVVKKLFLILILLFIFLAPSRAYFFRSYQVEDGLSHNCIWTVMQDSHGFMWFGSVDGLNRFDGKSFKIYKKQPGDPTSIGSNFIHCLKEDSKGRFFVGTKQGLYLFDATSEIFTHLNLSDKSNEEDDTSINYIMEDPDGNIWIGCYGQGIYVLDSNLKLKVHYINNKKAGDIASNFVWTMVQDYNGVVWVGTDGAGLLRLDPKTGKFVSVANDRSIGITDLTIYSLYCDKDNNIWVGTSEKGLFRYNYRTGNVVDYASRSSVKILNIKAITEFSDSELIMGSDIGLVCFNKNKESFKLMNEDSTYDNITDRSIFSIAKDKEGGFWIGTYFGGVNYFSPAINRFSYYSSSSIPMAKKNIISSFAEDEYGRIWIGTNNEGLLLFNPKTSKFESVQQKINYHDIQSLMLDKDELWISLYGKGISILNIRTNSVVRKYTSDSSTNPLINNIVNNMYKTSKGVIILGMSEGANYLDPVDNKIKKYSPLDGVPIKDITEDYNGSIWFAAHMHGLFRLSVDGKWDRFIHNPNDPASLCGNNVNCVLQDAKYRIWVGTEGEGMTLFNPKENKFELVLTEKSGLPSNIIYSILEDIDGNIWASTGGGLAKIDPNTMIIKTFKYAEDLLKIRYNLTCGLRVSDNNLYFGGMNGFTTFNPKMIIENVYKPTVIITGFQIFGKEITPSDESSVLKYPISNTKYLVLNYNQSTFSFDFASLSYLSPNQNKYAYILEGFDNEWYYTDNTNNKAVYMNIPPGDYIFKVKGSNNDGVWSDEVHIQIEIKRPVWLSTWMIMAYLIFTVVILAYIISFYKKRLQEKNNEKIYKYKTGKEKEIYKSKINFFTNIAHEIRTPLSLIVAPLENIVKSEDGNQKTKTNLDIIQRNTNRLLELVNQLLDFRKIEEDMFRFNFRKQNVSQIVRNIYSQYNSNTGYKNITVQLVEPDTDIECVVDIEAIYKIVSNLISNAMKYAKHKVVISIKEEITNLIIAVQDDGVGIDSSFHEQIFEPFFQIEMEDRGTQTGSGLGLSLSQSLAIKHGGSITVQSQENKGSVFTLKIPIVTTEDVLYRDEDSHIGAEIVQEQQSKLNADSNLKILLVEDNKELCVFLSNSLSDNYTIFEAENGIKALEIIEKENLDIIISDILMPEMDGLELCNILKSNSAYSHIPFILLSAMTDISTKVEGLSKGADVYIEKPFSIEQLKAQIISIIDNRNHIRDNFIQSPLQYYKRNKENTENAEFIEKLNDIILEHLSDEHFSIDNLSELFSMSRSNFHKKIKSITGMTPNDYIKLIRLNQSAQLLSTGRYKINEVCYMVGFNTPSYFSKCFYEQFGKLPKDFV